MCWLLNRVAVLVQPRPSASNAVLVTQLRGIGAKVTGFSIQKMARAELPLERVSQLNGLDTIEKAHFDGDHSYLFGHEPTPDSKLDPYLIELIDYLGATPIIVQTPDGLTKEDAARVHAYGGLIKANLSIVNAYSASLPLARLVELAAWDRVKQITYDRKLIPS